MLDLVSLSQQFIFNVFFFCILIKMDDENEIYLCHKVTVRAQVISNIAYASIIVKSGLLSLVIKKKNFS